MLMDPTLVMLGGLILLMLLCGLIGWVMRGELDSLDQVTGINDAEMLRLQREASDNVARRQRVRAHSAPLKPSYDGNARAGGKGPL